MANFRFSMRTLLIVVSVAIVCFSIIAERVGRQQIAVGALLAMGSDAQFSRGDPDSRTIFATDKDYFSHWFRSINNVWLYPNDEYSVDDLLKITATIPGVESVSLFPADARPDIKSGGGRITVIFDPSNSVTDENIESIAELLPNIENLCVANASCSREKFNWFKSQMTNLKSGFILLCDDDGTFSNETF